jgi:hypothetical protein
MTRGPDIRDDAQRGARDAEPRPTDLGRDRSHPSHHAGDGRARVIFVAIGGNDQCVTRVRIERNSARHIAR